MNRLLVHECEKKGAHKPNHSDHLGHYGGSFLLIIVYVLEDLIRIIKFV